MVKRISAFLLAFVFVGSLAFMTSCGSDDKSTKTAPYIKFSFNGTVGQTGEVTLPQTTVLKLVANVGAGVGLKEVAWATDFGSLGTGKSGKVTAFPKDTIHTLEIDIDLTQVTAAGDVKVKVDLTPKSGTVINSTFTLTVKKANAGTMKTLTITMGDQTATTGSFAAAFDGTVYKLADVAANYGKIDMIFYSGSTLGKFIAGPTDDQIQTITWSNAVNWANWNPKNDTKFGKVTAADFDGATYASVAALTAGTTRVSSLANGDVVAFKTAAGKYGVFKVTALSTEITIEVKIQDQPAR